VTSHGHLDHIGGLVTKSGALAFPKAQFVFVDTEWNYSGFGLTVNWIAADIIRMKDGILLEHWDVIQDEATEEQSKSGNPMFGDSFPPSAHSGKSTFYHEAQTFTEENSI
jgi:hypothetical protein